MLFIHDVHAVIGEHEFDFQDTFREEYAPAVAQDGARLLWYLHAMHGAGDAYKVVTITAVPDGAAWERFVERERYGDLASWRVKIDTMTYGSHSTLLVQTPWSPLGEIDLDALPPVDGDQREVPLFREDILDGPNVGTEVMNAAAGPDDVLTCAAAFTPLLHDPGTLHLLHRLVPRDRWTPAFAADTEWNDWSGSLIDALPAGTRRTSRMFRTTPWSPLA